TIRHLRLSKQLPFTCDVSFDNVAIPPLWDTELQYSAPLAAWLCVLTPKPSPDLEHLALFHQNVTLTVMGNLATESSNALLADQYNFDPMDIFHQVTLP